MANHDVGDHLDPTATISIKTIKERAVRGIVVLTGRTFLLSVISLVATGLLTVYLEPSEFGVFWIVSAVVNFLAYFSDIGLAAALIQKKDSVTSVDLKTTFTIQQVLVLSILVILFFASPIFQNYYELSFEGRILIYALGLSLLMSSLKTIPSVLLERSLEFEKLVLPQILENLVYSVSVVYFAWNGMGIRSFTYAVILRGLTGLIVIYILKPWLPGITISKPSLKKLLSFGVPYQANTLLATIKDNGMTIVLGGMLGATNIGFLGWAQKWGQAPLRFFMDHVIKVTFPAFSRIQSDKKSLKNAVTRSIFFICFFVFPTLIGLLVTAPLLVSIIPRYEKWQPALIPLYLIGINTVFAAVSTQLTNLLNSIGKIKITFKLMIMWTALTWMLVPFLAKAYGVNGAALAYSLVGVSSIVAIIVARRYCKFSFRTSVVPPFISAALMGIAMLTLKGFLSASFVSFWALVITGIIVYSISIYLIVGSSIIRDIKLSFRTLFSFKRS